MRLYLFLILSLLLHILCVAVFGGLRTTAPRLSVAQGKSGALKPLEITMAFPAEVEPVPPPGLNRPVRKEQSTPAPRKLKPKKRLVHRRISPSITKPPDEKEIREQEASISPETKVPRPLPQKEESMPKQSGARWIRKADYIRNIPPRYPRISRRRGEEGVVVIQVLIDASGIARNVKLYSSSGHSRLDKAAMHSINKWQFVPAIADGKKTSMQVLIPIRFELRF